ncbi:hypothetical protein JR316_0003378 [Psilocybe cubensis]|uniref:Uncharacterized protein n=1 Tax=Psilocybe cubensis TaxID=181762 RepID=A0ACB8H860_PSICU|nr:hypothetical protein JR316_0003378 [Psilocybe cubensis]KAH9483900.1 hypothetical protein JR316_0003378 [Psilocybe cubensis]
MLSRIALVQTSATDVDEKLFTAIQILLFTPGKSNIFFSHLQQHQANSAEYLAHLSDRTPKYSPFSEQSSNFVFV